MIRGKSHSLVIESDASEISALPSSLSGETLAKLTPTEFNAQLIGLWISRYKSAGTQRVYRGDIGAFLEFISNHPLYEITYIDMQAYEEHLLEKELAPRTYNRMIGTVRSLLSFGCEKVRMLPTNVGAILGARPIKDDLAQRILTEDQVFQILETETNSRNNTILKLLYYMGIRVSELCNLKWSDLQDRGDGCGQAIVFGKGGKTRVVLISHQVWNQVNGLRGDAGKNDPVFRSAKGGHLDQSQVFRIVKAAAVKAGVDGNVSPHWFRHSHASHAMDRGAPLHVVQANLGHSNPAITGRYLHARPSEGSGSYLGG
jgi:integrase/recombinase XerD